VRREGVESGFREEEEEETRKRDLALCILSCLEIDVIVLYG